MERYNNRIFQKEFAALNNMDIVLESERLRLRPLSYRELLHIKNDELEALDVCIETDALSGLVSVAISKKIEKMRHAAEDVHKWFTYWIIIDKDSKKGIGFIGFKGLPDETGHTEVGYSISPEHRKQGLMTEALKTLINWANGSGRAKGLTAKVIRTNIGSVNVLNNCGFKLACSYEQEDVYILEFE